MKKILKISGIIILVLLAIGILAGKSENKSVQDAPKESQKQDEETSEEKLTTDEEGEKVFNQLGWNLYKAQFNKEKTADDKDCFKDKQTCQYWENLAEEYGVAVNDVKYVLYSAESVALDKKQQTIYDKYYSGLQAISNKTDEEGEKYTAEFTEEQGLERYELNAIIAKGDLYKE